MLRETQLEIQEIRKNPDILGISRKNFKKLMPVLVLAYVIAFIDRTNIGMVKHELEINIGISAASFGLGAGLFFVAYALLEVPSNLIMHRTGARFWIARIMVTWGLLSTAMAFVWNDVSFYILRIALGAAEAGLYPGIILYLTYWFPRADRAKAIGLFLLGVSLANIIGAPLAGLLLQLDGMAGLHGYQWMFLLEGIPAVLLCFWVWFKLPNNPNEANWLKHEEKELLISVLADEDKGAKSKHNDLRALAPVLKDIQIWIVVVVYFSHQIAVYSLSYFLPSIIRSFDSALTPFTVGLITALPWLAAAIGSIVLPRYAKNMKRAKLLVFVGMLLISVGLLVASSNNLITSVFGFCISAFMLFVIQSVLFTFPSHRFSGASAASGIAFINTCGLFGGFLGPTVMGVIEMRTGNEFSGLWFITILCLFGGLISLFLKYENHKKQIEV